MRRLGVLLLALSACATRPPPVTKIVNGRVIVTRSISPSAYEHVARALIYEEEQRYGEAASELQRALIYDGEAVELRAHLAEVFIRLGRLDDAQAEVKASLARGDNVPALVADAHLRQLRRDPTGAVAALERAVALTSYREEPSLAENTALELADAALLAMDAPRARRALETVCRSAPESIVGRLRLASVAWAMGDLHEAEVRLKESLTLEPNQLQALLELATLYAALGRKPEARAVMTEALDRSEGAPEVAAAYARYLVTIGARKEAEQIADDLPPPDLGDAEEFAGHLEVERAAKRFDQALALVEAAGRGEPSQELRARLPLLEAMVRHDRGEGERAIAVLLAVPKDSPVHFTARLEAASLLRDGKAAEAAKLLEALEATDDEQTLQLAIARALTAERQGDPARAARVLETALVQHPRHTRLTMALAAIEDRRGQWQRALALVEPVLAAEPSNQEALNFWGFVAVDNDHDLRRATGRLVAALALDTGSAAIIDSVGWAHLRAGDLTRAALFLEQAGHLEPEDPEILSHLGELYLRREEKDRALTAFRRALALKPEETLRRKLEESLARIGAQKAARP